MENIEQRDVIVSDDSIANVNVSFEVNELTPYKQQYIAEKRKHVVLRGFRKGTAPESMVAKYFNDEATEAAKNNLLYNKYNKLLQDFMLQPLSRPILEKVDESDGKVSASFSVEVLQPVNLGQYLGLPLKKYNKHSVDEEIADTLRAIKNKYPKLVEKSDLVAQNGNVVIVDFTMYFDGVEVESHKELKVLLGSNLFYNEFETNLIGVKAGDNKEFSVVFSDTYHKESFRGKTGLFKLDVKSVNDVVDYTDDELSDVLKYENTDKMFEALTNEINEKVIKDERNDYENQILEQLLDSHQFKVPKILLETEKRQIATEKPDVAIDEIDIIAEKFVKTDMILKSIYERHPEIHITNDKITEELNKLGTKAGDTFDVVVEKLRSTGKLGTYVNYLKNCAVIDFLIGMSDIKE